MIRTQKDGPLWTAWIDRPQKANSLTEEMLGDLADFAIAAKGEANAFILRGEGKVFSAGADLEQAPKGLAVSPTWERLSGAIADLPCLTIAALNGALAGGAFGMALACDLRIAVPTAKFFYPVMKLGFLPQPSDPARMSALIGPSRSKLILMAGQKVTAQEALSFGLIDRIVEPEAMNETLSALTADSLGAAPTHVSGIKALVI
ncbi:MAG: enoyl-CoA hydratase/isomerase family protein [Paracoccaceae bacterium]